MVSRKNSENTSSRFIFEFQLWRAGEGGVPVSRKSKFIVSAIGKDAEKAAKKAWEDIISRFATHLWLERGIIWDIGVFCQPLRQSDLPKEIRKNLQQGRSGQTILLENR